MNTIDNLLNTINQKLISLNLLIPIKNYLDKIEEINFQLDNPNIWSDQKKSTALTKERQYLLDLTNKLKEFASDYSFYKELYSLDKDEAEKEISVINSLNSNINDFELKLLMDEKTDTNNAIITLSAGSGGLESANFVSIILRMILRYCELKKYKTEILDLQSSEEYSDICIDSVVISVNGENAYGFTKALHGVYKFVRNSPFSSSDKRHTSFIACAVEYEIEDDIKVDMPEKDLEIVAYKKSAGPGGQNSNKVASAVRIKHIPTGIVVACCNERDQLANKKMALQRLKAKLYKLEEERVKGNYDKYLESLKDNSFANQTFSFTYSPYTLVKDEDTGFKITQLDKVLDGELQELIEQRLRFLKNK